MIYRRQETSKAIISQKTLKPKTISEVNKLDHCTPSPEMKSKNKVFHKIVEYYETYTTNHLFHTHTLKKGRDE